MNEKSNVKACCHWCGKHTLPVRPEWEQRDIMTLKYQPMCDACANRKLRLLQHNPFAGLHSMRKIHEPNHTYDNTIL